ncbi:hypothetical protein CLV63_12451 [Murinocardiopsis flavida]|uniref:Uncharacterized protein n=1 Tax=Murinocardiopsis flavida TaxID=645275 RepID=A0A2P8CYD6_9ACTN|nr:hypothetical protein [Murinocardiopsis flavida]PSK89947.1 hypothetical protein CLV63_12451 [Murinocardiopsis flavida]
MTTLIHTGMQVPTDRIRVTRLDQVDIGVGVAWSAVVRNGRTKLGVIANDGRMGSQFHPVDLTAQQVMRDFVAQCRDRAGEPLNEEFVIDELANEYEIAAIVTQTERKKKYVARGFDQHGIPELQTFALTGDGPLDYAAALAAAPNLDLNARTVRAELWMGPRGWVEFYQRHDT